MSGYRVFFAALFICNAILFAQPYNLRFEHITVEDGLSSNNVNCIFQDQYGFMWFGTESGIDKYDGYAFLNYDHDPKDSSSISDNMVTAVQEDDSGNLWIATMNGLNRLDQTTGRFEHFFNDPDNKNCPSANIITALYIDNENTIWFGTTQGLDKLTIDNDKEDSEKYIFRNYRIDTTQTYSFKNIITVIYEGSDGLLWIGTRNGLYRFNKNSETFYPYISDPQDLNTISGNYILAIGEDKNNYLWISTGYVRESGAIIFSRSGLLNKYDKKTNRFTRYVRNEDPFFISFVSSIAEDQNGTLWFGAMENHGLYRYEKESDQFIRYGYSQDNPNSINSNFVTDIYFDKAGTLWIATRRGGISKYDPNQKKFSHFIHLPGVANSLHFNNVTGIIEDSFGKVWIGTWGKKTTVYDPATELFDKYTHILYHKKPNTGPKYLSWPWVLDVYEDREKNIWIGTTIGLNKYDRATKTYKKYFEKHGDPKNPNFLSSNYINCIFQDSRNNLWIGTQNGLNKMNIKDETFKQYFHNLNDSTTISANFIHCIYEDKSGDLWFGSFGGGLNLYDRENDQFKRFFHDPSDEYSLSNDRVRVITEDKSGNIWIGTMMGLNKFDKQTQKFTIYTTRDGLCNNYVVGILEDDHGNLWISTKNGLSKFNPDKQTFRNYDVTDGLQSNEFNKMSYHKGKSGRFYFGGINGFNMFYPDSIKDNPIIPPVLITSMQIFNKPVQLNQSILETEKIELAYFENDISFHFVALNYTNSHKNQYAYQLAGYDDSWRYCGTQHFADYTNLDPGEYTFRVKGSNNDLIWNEKGASIQITILPPWWRRWWAYTFYVILTAAVLFSAFRFETNRREMKHRAIVAELQARTFQAQKQAEQEIMRGRIAGDLHDEIGGNLSSIILLGETLERHLKPTGKEKQRLQQIRHIAMATAESMRDIVWFVNPLNDDMDKLLVKMRETANTMLSQVKLQFDVQRSDDAVWQGDLNFRRNLFLFYKEALQNIIRHAQAKQVVISIRQTERLFHLRIQDDGVGFDAGKPRSGNGLKNYKRRAKEMNADFSLKTEPENGTEVNLTKKIP